MSLEVEFKYYQGKSKTLFCKAVPSFFSIYLIGNTEELHVLEKAVCSASVMGSSKLTIINSENKIPLFIYRSKRDLQVIELDPGLLICANREGLIEELSASIKDCIRNSRKKNPILGYHSHISLYDCYCTEKPSIVGELTIVWFSSVSFRQARLE